MNRSLRFGLMGILLWVALSAQPSHAQTEPPPPPIPQLPPETDSTRGLILYQSRCANCHGRTGLGDGDLAAQAILPPPAIGTADYLRQASPQSIFETIYNGNLRAGMPGFGADNNSDPLTDQQIWDITAALYEMPNFANVLPTATITGTAQNGTAGQPLGNGIAYLQGFTLEFEEAYLQESEIGADGNFRFNLSNVPAQWLYRIVVPYGGLDYSSEFGRLRPAQPQLALPVTVYDQTVSPAGIEIDQLDVVVEFTDTGLRINEVYRFSNRGTAVFIGESGNYEEGTLAIQLPEQAQNPTFLRSFGANLTDFSPADEQMRLANNHSGQQWRYTLPIPVGDETVRLLARYELPYTQAERIGRVLPHNVRFTSLVLSERGVSLNGNAGARWRPSPTAAGENAPFTRYEHPPLQAGEALTFALQGNPQTVQDSAGNRVRFRDENRELAIGLMAFIAACLFAAVMVYRWRKQTL